MKKYIVYLTELIDIIHTTCAQHLYEAQIELNIVVKTLFFLTYAIY